MEALIQAQTFRMSWGPESTSLWLTRPLGYWEAQLVCYICFIFSYSLWEHYHDKRFTIILTLRWTSLYFIYILILLLISITRWTFFIFIYILKLIISSFTRWTGLLLQYQDLEDVLVLLSPTLWQIRRSIHIQ